MTVQTQMIQAFRKFISISASDEKSEKSVNSPTIGEDDDDDDDNDDDLQVMFLV